MLDETKSRDCKIYIVVEMAKTHLAVTSLGEEERACVEMLTREAMADLEAKIRGVGVAAESEQR
jgi:hypothetical protein